MMGNKKLAAIREELKAAFAAEGRNPITALDRRIRKRSKQKSLGGKEPRSLMLLRSARAQVIGGTAGEPGRTRAKRGRKAS